MRSISNSLIENEDLTTKSVELTQEDEIKTVPEFSGTVLPSMPTNTEDYLAAQLLNHQLPSSCNTEDVEDYSEDETTTDDIDEFADIENDPDAFADDDTDIIADESDDTETSTADSFADSDDIFGDILEDDADIEVDETDIEVDETDIDDADTAVIDNTEQSDDTNCSDSDDEFDDDLLSSFEDDEEEEEAEQELKTQVVEKPAEPKIISGSNCSGVKPEAKNEHNTPAFSLNFPGRFTPGVVSQEQKSNIANSNNTAANVNSVENKNEDLLDDVAIDADDDEFADINEDDIELDDTDYADEEDEEPATTSKQTEDDYDDIFGDEDSGFNDLDLSDIPVVPRPTQPTKPNIVPKPSVQQPTVSKPAEQAINKQAEQAINKQAELEAENARLKAQLLEAENARLRAQLEQAQKPSIQQPVKPIVKPEPPKTVTEVQATQQFNEDAVRWEKYAKLSNEDLMKKVRAFMIQNHVQIKPIKAALMNKVFGEDNIKRLSKSFIIPVRVNGILCYTMG